MGIAYFVQLDILRGLDREETRREDSQSGEIVTAEERRRLVEEWTARLSDVPGWRGRVLRSSLERMWE